MLEENTLPDIITRITLDYHKVSEIEPCQAPEAAIQDTVTWNYTEQLIIDREAATLMHTQCMGTGCTVSRRYEIPGVVECLLDGFDAENLFSYVEGNPDDVIDTPDETRSYKISVCFQNRPPRIIEGSFDKKGLPEDFSLFAETVSRFMRFYDMSEAFSPSIYGNVKRHRTEYIFCSVAFDNGYKSYYYLTEDESIEIGDWVVVPAGQNNHEVIVEVVNIEYFNEENVPLPLEKTKWILRKCEDMDFNEP